MKVLAIDTAGWVASAALWEEGRELAFKENTQDRSQAALLAQLVKEVTGEHKVDKIIVNVGPGSFTGIRLGIAFAKGLAMGWKIPLIGMDGFTVTYLGIEPDDDVLILIEARRQDVYARRFQKGIPQTPCSLTKEDIEAILLAQNPPRLTGSGVHPFLEGLPFDEASSQFHGAQALAYAFFKSPQQGVEPSPFYVREADVTYSPRSCSPLP